MRPGHVTKPQENVEWVGNVSVPGWGGGGGWLGREKDVENTRTSVMVNEHISVYGFPTCIMVSVNCFEWALPG